MSAALADDVRFIAAHAHNPRDGERLYEAADALDDLLEALVACNGRLLVKGMIGDAKDEAALKAAKNAIAKARAPQADTHPKDGDAQQAPLVSGGGRGAMRQNTDGSDVS